MYKQIMFCKLFPVLFFIYIKFTECQSKRYDNYSMFKAIPTDDDQLEFLKNVEKRKYIDIIFWQRPQKLFSEVQFLVNPNDKEVLIQRAAHFGLDIYLIVDNIQERFDAQTFSKYTGSQINSFTWDAYHTLDDIYQWLIDLSIQYANIFKLESIGKSHEGRDIFAITIKKSNTDTSVMVEGGIHGNEWVAVEFMTYLISCLLDEKRDSFVGELSFQYTWYVLPIVNPDGLAYTQTQDRMWRRNVKTLKEPLGIDLDRNFDYKFGSFDSSHDPKDENFCGPRPFSEPETRVLAQFINKKAQNLKYYFSIHAYGQLILIPYSDRVQHLDNFREMENFCKQAVLNIYTKNGAKYATGTTFDTLGIKVSGNSASWVKKNYDLGYVITLVLRDTGSYGYALPNSEIIPACKDGVIAMSTIMTARPKRLKSNLFSSSGHQFQVLFFVNVLNILILIFIQ